MKRYWPKSDFHKPLNVYVVFFFSLLTFMLSFSFVLAFLCLLFGQNKIQKRSLALVKKHKPYWLDAIITNGKYHITWLIPNGQDLVKRKWTVSFESHVERKGYRRGSNIYMCTDRKDIAQIHLQLIFDWLNFQRTTVIRNHVAESMDGISIHSKGQRTKSQLFSHSLSHDAVKREDDQISSSFRMNIKTNCSNESFPPQSFLR